MARKSLPRKSFGISVVGLSGSETEKGNFGVGKSCLCNRFVRPNADDYNYEHISVLSQTDFSGRVVNNDQWLYWGNVRKRTDDGQEYTFQISEQTEFSDDSSFQPFRTGKNESYLKRCTCLKLNSAEKLAYICKNQLGLEHDFDEKYLPDGRLDVDGFICVYDVSAVPQRPSGRQFEFCSQILHNIIKLKKPVVLATTKNDQAVPLLIAEAEKLVQRKDFKSLIQIVETSSVDNINVDAAFLQLAYLIEKSRIKHKIVSYRDSFRDRQIMISSVTRAYESLILDQFHVNTFWHVACRKLEAFVDYQQFVELQGTQMAKNIFKRHMRKLQDEHVERKKQEFITAIPQILEELLPDITYIASGDWDQCQQLISQMPNFHEHFVDSNDIPWEEDDILFADDDKRIPFNFLQTSESETCFRNHVNALHAERHRQNVKNQFRLQLDSDTRIIPGLSFESVAQLFRGQECFDALSEQDRRSVYLQRQNYLTEQSKVDFVELLQENPDLFDTMERYRSPSPKIIQRIHSKLGSDPRYAALDRLQQTRDSVLLEFINFTQNAGLKCPTADSCVDILINNVISSKQSASQDLLLPLTQLHLVILGSNGLSDILMSQLRAEFTNDEYTYDRRSYVLNYRPIGEDVRLPQNAIWSDNFQPDGIICCFNSLESMEFLRTSLEQTVLSEDIAIPCDRKTPIVVVQGRNDNLNDMNRTLITVQGRNLAARLHCLFMDHSATSAFVFDSQLLQNCLTDVVQNNKLRGHTDSVSDHPPDLRVLLCMCCGDPFPIDLVLSPLLNQQGSETNTDDESSIIIDVLINDKKIKTEICISSYHGARHMRNDFHGYILVYSAKRYASFASMSFCISKLSAMTSCLVLAVTESGLSNTVFTENTQHLLNEGSMLSETHHAQFLATSANFRQQSGVFDPFFSTVWTNLSKAPVSPPIPQRLLPSSHQRLSSSASVRENTHSLPPPLPPPRARSSSGQSPIPHSRAPIDDYQNIWVKRGGKGASDEINREPLVRPSTLKGRFESANFSSIVPEKNSPADGVEKPQLPPRIAPKPLNRDKFASVTSVLDRMNVSGKRSVTPKDWSPSDSSGKLQPSPVLNSFSLSSPSPGHAAPTDPRLKEHHVFSDSESYTSSYERRNLLDNEPISTFSPQLRRRLEQRTLIPKQLPIPIPTVPSSDSDNSNENENMMRVSRSVRNRRSFRLRNQPKKKENIPFSDTESRSPSQLRQSKSFMPSDRQRQMTRATTEPSIRKITRRSLSTGDDNGVIILPPEDVAAKPGAKRSKESRRSKKKKRGAKGASLPSRLDDYDISKTTGVPMLIENCIYFLEQDEAIAVEGLYRVPGNKAFVDELLKKLTKNPNFDLKSANLQVGTVATTLKTFFSDLPTPLISEDLYDDLFKLMSISDKTDRLFQMRDLISKRMSPLSHRVLAYIIVHLSRVALNSQQNCMTPQNLAIVWWPTLLRPNFSNLQEFNRQSSSLQAVVQLWIENCDFFFDNHYEHRE